MEQPGTLDGSRVKPPEGRHECAVGTEEGVSRQSDGADDTSVLETTSLTLGISLTLAATPLGPKGCKEAAWTADKVFWENIMWNSGHDAYLESRVLTADPLELVNLLYQAGAKAVREARYHLAEGRIAERSREINKACEIVIELAGALDHERGGEISQRLALLYDYMQRRLIEANMRQIDAPLADVLGLLTTLAEAWAGIRKPEETREETRVVESPWSQPMAQEVGCGSQGWSL